LAYFLMVVGCSDFAISSHIDTESGEPDGIAGGQTKQRNAAK
jgi:hypothetical protein